MARAGRPRKPATRRLPSGAAYTPAADREAAVIATVVAQRINHGATVHNALDQRHATPLGRMFLAGKLGAEARAEDRFLALDWYAGLHRAMRRAIASRDPYAGSKQAGGCGADPDPRSVLQALARHRDADRVIPAASRTAVWRIVVCEEPDAPPHLIGPLLAAADALHMVRAGEHAARAHRIASEPGERV